MARILIAEDDELQRELLAYRLRRQGHHVTSTSDGEELLERLYRPGEKNFDVVVTDNCMTEMTGVEVLRCIKLGVSHSGLPVVVFSDIDEPKTLETIKRLGGVFINKRDIERLLEFLGNL